MSYPLLFQDDVFHTLEKLKSGGRFPHALIFEGAPGSGKQTAARYAASMLLCREDKISPCGECVSCKKSLENHPDFSVLLPENKSKTISVDKVREIRLSAYVTPHEAMRKVYFIPEAQRLRTEAQNALLKLIEEPPEAAYFIMTAPSRSGLLETVISRSAVIPMRELSSDERFSAAFKQLPEHNGADLRVLSLSCRTVGDIISAASDPTANQLITDTHALWDAVKAGERYFILQKLYSFEKDRESYIKLFQSLRSVAVYELCGSDISLGALRTNRIIDIIDKIAFSATQNAALPLLSCAAADRLIEAAHSI